MPSTLFLAIGSLVAVLLAIRLGLKGSSTRGRSNPYPPGPPPKPIIGTLVPLSNQWSVYQGWAKKYGPIVHFQVFKRHIIILDTLQAVLDLFEKRSKVYCGRPQTEMTKMVGRDVSVILSQPGERLNEYRKLLRAWLNPEQVNLHYPVQREEVLRYLSVLSNSYEGAESVLHHSRRLTGSIALRLAYGELTPEDTHRLAELGDDLARILSTASNPRRWLVNSFPALRYVPAWMPGAYFKRWAAEAGRQISECIHSPVRAVQRKMSLGHASSSFTSHFLTELETQAEEASQANYLDIISCTANSFYAAGTDTSSAYLNTCFFLLSLHPEVQEKAFAEINKVLGPGRLVTLEDRDDLPYVANLMKEVHRTHPVAPLVSHTPIEDDTYQGYVIPKGASVYANFWSILHDPEEYPDPHKFNPDRFMAPNSSGELPFDPTKLTFGLGRRSCPGKLLGENSIFLAVANALAAFKLSDPISMKGAPLTIQDMEFTPGLVSSVKPFKCKFSWRSSDMRDLVMGLAPK